MKLLSEDEASKRLFPHLKKSKGKLSIADASAATGMALEDSKTALERLMNMYACRLQLTASGEILYDFGNALRRRGEKSFHDIIVSVADALWRGFKVVFKLWITVTLVVYFALFVALLLALIIAAQSRDSKVKIKFHWIGDLFADLFLRSSRTMMIVHATDSYGYGHRSFRQEKRNEPGKQEAKKRFVQSVYDFVFGPPRPGFDPFANEKEVLAWLRKNNGILTPTEIVALAGWTFSDAEERMADYLTRFKGEAEITDDGVLVGSFTRVLAKGDAEMEGGKIELFWDEYEAPYETTGNSATRNFAISGMNIFNLLLAALILLSAQFGLLVKDLASQIGMMPGLTTLVLGWVPLVFSSIFFLVPAVRIFSVKKLEAERLAQNKRRRLIRVIFANSGRERTLAEIVQLVNAGAQSSLPGKEIRRILDSLLTELHGETTLREDGTVLYSFPRIRHEVEAAATVRNTSLSSGAIGDVIFDTLPEPPPESAS